MLEQIDLEKLRVFHAVVEAGSFSEAGRRLLLSQPSVSGHVRQLESRLGVRLFERIGRGIRPTAAGASLFDYSRRIFSLERDALRALGEHEAAQAGEVLVAASSTPGTYVLPGILGRFHRDHPRVRLSLEISDTADALSKLLSFQADIGVIGEAADSADLELIPWIEDDLVLVCGPSHEWARSLPPDAGALQGRPFIHREPGSSIRSLTERWLESEGVSVDRVMELGSPAAVISAVGEGLGVSITTRLAVEEQLSRGDLFLVPLPHLPIHRRLNLITNRIRPLPPAAKALLATLREARPTLSSGLVSG